MPDQQKPTVALLLCEACDEAAPHGTAGWTTYRDNTSLCPQCRAAADASVSTGGEWEDDEDGE